MRMKVARADIFANLAIVFVFASAFAPFIFFGRSLQESAIATRSIFSTGSRDPSPATLDVYEVLDPGASAWLAEPEFHIMHDIVFREHALPAWNPYSGYGMPLLANMQSQPFSPLAWPVIIHPSARVYSWWVVFRLYVAAVLAYLYFRQFFSAIPSLGGAISFALAGYFLLYVTMPELSVNVLIPGLLFAVERVVRRPGLGTAASLALMLAATVFGGMPESEALLCLFALFYWACRVIGCDVARTRKIRVLCYSTAGATLGLALSAIAILPLLEYIPNSYNTHAANGVSDYSALISDHLSIPIVATYFVPLLFGPPYNNVFSGFVGYTGVRGFTGVATVVFALTGIAAITRKRPSHLRAFPALLFAVAAVFLFAKRFGLPPAQWIGYLPIVRQITMLKYDEAIIAMCVAALATFGLQMFLERRVSSAILIAGFVPVLAVLAFVDISERAALFTVGPHAAYYFDSLGLSLATLLLVAGTVVAVKMMAPKIVGLVAVVLMAVGPIAGFVVPLYWIVDASAPDSADPYLAGDFLTYLKTHRSADTRVTAQDDLLTPEWNAAFGLADVRALDAFYPARYIPFLNAVLPPSTEPRELLDRLTNFDVYDLSGNVAKKFLNLSAIRFIVSNHAYGLQQSVVDAYPFSRPSFLRVGMFTVGGVARPGLFMKARRAAEGMPYRIRLRLPVGVRAFATDIGMPDEVWKYGSCGDGSRFIASISDVTTGRVESYSGYIDPKTNVAQRRWQSVTLPARAFAGRTVDLSLNTIPGPSPSLCGQWDVWGAPTFIDGRGARTVPGDFTEVFRSAVATVYEAPAPSMRLRLYHKWHRVRDGAGALRALHDPSFDPKREAIVEGQSAKVLDGRANDHELAANEALAVSFSNDVEAVVKASQPSLLVLSDTYYPGWVATVDERRVEMFPADYMFRGIAVPKGVHRVRFTYRPNSIVFGASISGFAFVTIAIFYALELVEKRRHSAKGGQAR